MYALAFSLSLSFSVAVSRFPPFSPSLSLSPQFSFLQVTRQCRKLCKICKKKLEKVLETLVRSPTSIQSYFLEVGIKDWNIFLNWPSGIQNSFLYYVFRLSLWDQFPIWYLQYLQESLYVGFLPCKTYVLEFLDSECTSSVSEDTKGPFSCYLCGLRTHSLLLQSGLSLRKKAFALGGHRPDFLVFFFSFKLTLTISEPNSNNNKLISFLPFFLLLLW